MKRSEAVKLIADTIMKHNIEIGDFPGYGAMSAESVLAALEKAGIRPPTWTETKLGPFKSQASIHIDWEPEENPCAEIAKRPGQSHDGRF